VLDVYGLCAGRELSVEEETFESERATGHRNRAIGHMLRTFEILDSDPETALDLYFRQCSVSVDCRDVSLMAATLANGGVHPLTGARAMSAATVETVLSVMTTCGMYDGTGDWVEGVGMPSKSGVSGGILAVLPGQLGVCVYSPPLDPRGNSVRGLDACRRLARDLHLHFLHVTRPSRSVVRASYDIGAVPSKRLRSPAEREALTATGSRVRVYELQGDLLFTGGERVVRTIIAAADQLDAVIVDVRGVSHLSGAAASMLGDLRSALLQSGKQLAIVDSGEHSSLRKAVAARALPDTPGVPVFEDRDAATEWAENLLLGDVESLSGTVALAECQLCRGLSAEHLARLEALLEERELQPGDFAVHSGDPAEEIFILACGELSVMLGPAAGGHRLATIAAGATFGELAIVGRSARSADVRADRPSRLLVLHARDFEELAQSCPELQAALLRNLLRGAYEIVERTNRELASVVSR
jgi:glutaminase